MATETWTDAETLRRAANAVRNLIDGHGDRRWCDWVPRHLDLIADRMDKYSEPAPWLGCCRTAFGGEGVGQDNTGAEDDE